MKRLSAALLLLGLPALAAGPRELPPAPAALAALAPSAAPAALPAALRAEAVASDDAASAQQSLDSVAAAVAAVPRPGQGGAEAAVASGAAVESALAGADVTADFSALHDAVGAGTAGPLPEEARRASYRLVAGFLGNHIHDYFGAGMERLRALGLDARRVPVHTEGKRRQAFALIEEAVRQAPHPVVLVGHSRGGTLIHDWYRSASPELKAKVARLVIVQAPLRGTSYIEWFLESRWRRFKATKLGPWVYGVNVMRGLFELIRPTRSWVMASLPAWQPGDLAKVLTVRSSIEPGANRFYDKDRALMAERGEPENDGRVPTAGGRVDGARDVLLRGVDHQQLIVQRPDLRRRLNGYAPHPRFNAADAAEALVRLLFR